jgi:hypothetical protein
MLETADDLLNIEQLNPKLWVVLSCPTSGLEFDSHTLDLLDTDHDKHIRVPEVIAAVKWSAQRLTSLSSIISGGSALALSEISQATPEGKAAYASASRILQSLGKPGASAISCSDTIDTAKILTATALNGDGIVPPHAARTPFLAQAIEDVMATVGSTPDLSGKPGVSRAQVDAFFEEAAAFVAWCRAGDALTIPGFADREAASEAGAALRAVRAKVEEHFARLRLAAFDPRAAAALNRTESDYAALAAKDLVAHADELTVLPLQRIEPGASLALTVGINPAWAARIEAFRRSVATPLLGDGSTHLTESDWNSVQAAFASFDLWLASKKGALVEKLGRARCEELLASDARGDLHGLIQQDLALAPEFEGLGDVDRLVHYKRDLLEFVSNFVNLSAFYTPGTRAIFQTGTLYLDQRSCDLCLRVEDPAAHAAVAANSQLFLAYCACTRESGEKMSIVAAFTQGDSDFLAVGRNGIFYDRAGRDWNATVVKVVQHPIGLRQAFWAPYRRFAKLVEDQVQSFAAAKDKAVQDAAVSGVSNTAQGLAVPQPPARTGFDVARFAGIFAAIGLAIGAIGGVLGAMLHEFVSLAWWQMPLAAGGVILAISGPSVLITGLKLSQRTLGPLLEGNGWAINGRVSINLPLGQYLTAVRTLPSNASRSLHDPFEDTQSAVYRRYLMWGLIAVALVLLLRLGWGVLQMIQSLVGTASHITQLAPTVLPK